MRKIFKFTVLPAVPVIVPLTAMNESLESHKFYFKILVANSTVFELVYVLLYLSFISVHFLATSLEVKSTILFKKCDIFYYSILFYSIYSKLNYFQTIT